MTVLTFKGNSTLYLNSVIRTINGIFIRFSAVQVGYIWYSFSNLVEVLRNHLTIHSLLHAFVCFRTFIFLNYFIKLLYKSMWQQDKSKMFITQICTPVKKNISCSFWPIWKKIFDLKSRFCNCSWVYSLSFSSSVHFMSFIYNLYDILDERYLGP